MKKTAKRPAQIQIGLWLNHKTLDVVWLESQNISQNPPRFLRLSENEINELLQRLSLQYIKGKVRFITSLLPHNIWSKTLILPHTLNAEEAEQQCEFTLENDLPLPLDQVWKDYTARELKQGYRLDIFAVKKTLARQQLNRFLPWRIDVLDNAAKTLIRATTYLLGEKLPPNSLIIYQDADCDLIVFDNLQTSHFFSQKTIQPSDVKNSAKPTVLYEQFCERYKLSPTKVYYHNAMSNDITLPTEWLRLQSDYPLMALGNALWSLRDLHTFVNPIQALEASNE